MNQLHNLSVYQALIQSLKQAGCQYQQVKHKPADTCQQAAQLGHRLPEQGVKALVCLAEDQAVLMALPCTERLNFAACRQVLGIKNFRLASPQQVKQITGLDVGSIPPAGNLLKLPFYLDQKVAQQPEISFAAGRNDVSIQMQVSDYLHWQKQAVLADLSQSLAQPKPVTA